MPKTINFSSFVNRLKEQVAKKQITKKLAGAKIRGKIASIGRKKKKALEQEKILKKLGRKFSKKKKLKKRRIVQRN